MAVYVKIKNSIVVNSIVADADFISSYSDNEPGKWIEVTEETDYGMGWRYNSNTQEFRSPKPYATWTWNSDENVWQSPVEKPTTPNDDDEIIWNDDTQQWDVIPRIT
jgi:hypothetical protein